MTKAHENLAKYLHNPVRQMTFLGKKGNLKVIMG